MNYDRKYFSWHMCWVLAWLVLVTGCGAEKPASRLKQVTVPRGEDSRVQPDPSIIDAEDVVAMMLAADKLEDQITSAEALAERKASLLPLFEESDPGEALVVDQSSLSLTNDELADVREQIDIRSFDTPVKNQGSRPWCTSFATIAAVENLGKRFFNSVLDLSEIHHFKSYNVYQTSPSLEAGKVRGFIDENLWPYYGQKQIGADSKVRAKLSASKKIKLTLSDVIRAIKDGQPVVINLDVNGSFMNPKTGGIILPGGVKQGGHAIALTGVVVDGRVGGGGYFIIKNSWGASWGNKGYGYIPFDYCAFSYCYAWAVGDILAFDDSGKLRDKIPSVIPSPLPEPTPRPVPSPQPSPRPAPTPDPSVDIVTVDSFKLMSSLKDYRGLLGAHFFVLEVDGNQSALSQVASVTYKVDGYRDFSALLANQEARAITRKDSQSRSYKIWGWQNIEAHATVRLKDGRALELKPLLVEL